MRPNPLPRLRWDPDNMQYTPESETEPVGSRGGSQFDLDAERVYLEALKVLLRKHKDYGPKNISGAPGGPLNGLRVRMWDKYGRIDNLLETGAEPQNESLRDSFLDMLNYAAIGLMVLDGKWPE